MEKEILVTGGLGYIGSHTVVELVHAGYKVVIIDDLSNSKKEVLNRIEQISGVSIPLYQIDLVDYQKMTQVLRSHPHISGAVHFAASKAVGESVLYPLKYYHNNLMSLLNLLLFFKKKEINF